MKICVTMKTPDAVDRALDEIQGCDDIEDDDESNANRKEIEKFLNRFFKYGETITLEFDTETETARVVPL